MVSFPQEARGPKTEVLCRSPWSWSKAIPQLPAGTQMYSLHSVGLIKGYTGTHLQACCSAHSPAKHAMCTAPHGPGLLMEEALALPVGG